MKKKLLLSILMILTIKMQLHGFESQIAYFVEPLFNFYSVNDYLGINNGVIESLKNPATLFPSKNINFEASSLSKRDKFYFGTGDAYLTQSNPNFAEGISFKVTDKLSEGIIYSIERNIDLKRVGQDVDFDIIVKLQQLSYTVPLSYRLNDTISFGASLTYSRFKSFYYSFGTVGSSELNAFYTQIGILLKPTDCFSLGISYTPNSKTSKNYVIHKDEQGYEFADNESISHKLLPESISIRGNITPFHNLSLSAEYIQKAYSKYISDIAPVTLKDQSIIRTTLGFSPTEFLSFQLGYCSQPDYFLASPFHFISYAQEFLTYGLGLNINDTFRITASLQDSSAFKNPAITNKQYAIIAQAEF